MKRCTCKSSASKSRSFSIFEFRLQSLNSNARRTNSWKYTYFFLFNVKKQSQPLFSFIDHIYTDFSVNRELNFFWLSFRFTIKVTTSDRRPMLFKSNPESTTVTLNRIKKKNQNKTTKKVARYS